MKKILFLVAVMALVASAANAQFKYGGGITLGSKMGIDDDVSEKMGIGINVRGDYYFSEKFSVSPGFTYFFPGTPDYIDMSAWQLNADAHYHFYTNESISVYGIGGLNYSHTKWESDLTDFFGLDDMFSVDGSAEDTDGEIGVDLGAGIEFGIFFGEVKYDSAFDGQMALTFGVLFGGN
ncbi:MAG: porin family protein [Bacteroidales bacterium]|nr:porin family protein [Bacteroidales bacterium]